MTRFSVQGIIRNGQVVLEAPLDLPDGAVVTVLEGPLATNEPRNLKCLPCSEDEKRKLLTAYNRLDLIDDPDWEEKVTADRIAAVEKLVQDAAGMRVIREATVMQELETQTASTS